MSHKAFHRQPALGNRQEEKAFTFQCSGFILVDWNTLKKDLCATKVFLLHALQLVALKLLVKICLCDKALTPQGRNKKCPIILLLLLFIWPQQYKYRKYNKPYLILFLPIYTDVC